MYIEIILIGIVSVCILLLYYTNLSDPKTKSYDSKLHKFLNSPITTKPSNRLKTNITKILDNLYISDYETSTNYSLLKSLGIKQIISVGKELPEHQTDDFKIKYIKVLDSPTVDISKYFDETYDFIKKDTTLVHCAMGISRSSTIVLAYLIRDQRMPLSQALAYVKSKRHSINPNKGFHDLLYQYSLKYT